MEEEEAQELQLHINGEPGQDSKLNGDISNELRQEIKNKGYHTYSWWLRVSMYAVLLVAGQTIATLLGRLYYDKGGNSKWLATLVQLVGFPLLLPCYYYINPNLSTIYATTNKPSFGMVKLSSCLVLVSVYATLGLILAGDSVLYSLGLLYLPVSTFSLISASQLAFNAVFSFFLNSQKFTPFIINSLVLLTISSTLLVLQHEPGSSAQSSYKSSYVIGFISAIGSSAGYSLMLSLTQLAFEKIFKKQTFKTILDMVTCQSLVATCAVLVGLFMSGEWKILRTEMDDFKLGKVSYLMILLGTTISWQAFSVGSVGLILEVSSLFSNVISTLGLPIVPVLAVVFFHDTMSGIKLISMVLAIWGFVSYAYQHYLDDQKPETDKQREILELPQPKAQESN